MFLLIKKEKNIPVIINASNYNSDFYFDHVEAEDIAQNCMLSFSSKMEILDISKFFLTLS